MVPSTPSTCDLCLNSFCTHGLGWRPIRVTIDGMDTPTAPHISPVLEPETMAALMLRYVEEREEVAYQYTHSLVGFFTIDLDIPEALQLARDIVTESTNDIRTRERR